MIDARILGEQLLNTFHAFRGGLNRSPLRQPEVNDQLLAVGMREELFLYKQVECDERKDKSRQRNANDFPAVRQAQRQDAAEAAIKRRIVNVVMVRAAELAQLIHVQQLVANEWGESHRDDP